jgi:L-lactate dehydrogenase complex protein LldG
LVEKRAGKAAMMGRQEILKRVREALSDVRDEELLGRADFAEGALAGTGLAEGALAGADFAEGAPIAWEYGRPTEMSDVVGLFIERIIDDRATVEEVADFSGIPALVARFLVEAGAANCAIPAGIDRAWLVDAEAAGIEICRDDPPLAKEALDKISAVVTAACVGMAETGTIALDHRSDQGRRILSLLPDTHICVIRADQIATDVPEGLARLEESIRAGLPITWISGPSATSDIELSRVEGVHGPRTLFVIIVR